jgi:cytochrome c551/c552
MEINMIKVVLPAGEIPLGPQPMKPKPNKAKARAKKRARIAAQSRRRNRK